MVKTSTFTEFKYNKKKITTLLYLFINLLSGFFSCHKKTYYLHQIRHFYKNYFFNTKHLKVALIKLISFSIISFQSSKEVITNDSNLAESSNQKQSDNI